MSDLFVWAVEPGVELHVDRDGNGVKLSIFDNHDATSHTATLESYRAERLAAFIRHEPPWDTQKLEPEVNHG